MGSYALATRRNQAAGAKNQELAEKLEAANRQLGSYSAQLSRMAIAKERNRLARELHDSVTQTVFSMTLATQSAVLLLNRDRGGLEEQLNRLSLLAQSALSEMHTLISELQPGKTAEVGLPAALHQHLASRRLEEDLSVTLEVTGDCPLDFKEEQALFRIVQEALNNIAKHAHTSQAFIRLHLDEPFWVEIQDKGRGFDLKQAQMSGGSGLGIMWERAREIGWEVEVSARPGEGTRVRVEKIYG
jgi:signal transduction histidine kinase